MNICNLSLDHYLANQYTLLKLKIKVTNKFEKRLI